MIPRPCRSLRCFSPLRCLVGPVPFCPLVQFWWDLGPRFLALMMQKLESRTVNLQPTKVGHVDRMRLDVEVYNFSSSKSDFHFS